MDGWMALVKRSHHIGGSFLLLLRARLLNRVARGPLTAADPLACARLFMSNLLTSPRPVLAPLRRGTPV
jgi:hypothetical protein